jgi:hypothetical protein
MKNLCKCQTILRLTRTVEFIILYKKPCKKYRDLNGFWSFFMYILQLFLVENINSTASTELLAYRSLTTASEQSERYA